MRHLYIISIFLFSGIISFSQTYNPGVDSIINKINQDSLIFYLRNLSGEDAVVIDGESTFIEHRVNNWGNELAGAYLMQALEGFGLTAVEQDYSSDGKNIYAIQQGTLYPDEYYMICAHYDAVDYYCADDNASGSSAVLESARLFSNYEFEYSIIYALWDEEELGLIGSDYYASQAASNGDVIHGVINMDMIAWDGDEDMVAEIHSSYQANSNDLANYIVEFNNLYDLQLTTAIQLPGTTASDHSTFWNNGYAAVLMIEEYYGGDFNPYYHTEQDRISILSMPFFHEMAKLSLGALASLATPVDEVISSFGTGQQISGVQINNYPNPFSNETTISFTTQDDSNVRMVLINSMGKEVMVLTDEAKPKGEHHINLNARDLPSGMYFIHAQSSSWTISHKMLIN